VISSGVLLGLYRPVAQALMCFDPSAVCMKDSCISDAMHFTKEQIIGYMLVCLANIIMIY